MITGIYFGEEFKIDQGQISGNPEITVAYEALREPGISPGEGDPDLVMFNRLKETLYKVTLSNYVPMQLNADVVY